VDVSNCFSDAWNIFSINGLLDENLITMARKKKAKNKGEFSKNCQKSEKRHTNKGWFKSGHEGYVRSSVHEEWTEPIPVQRLTSNIFKRVAMVSPSGLLYAPDADGQPGPAKLLRPIKGVDTEISTQYLEEIDSIDNEMRLINSSKNAEMWNNSIREHIERAECDQPHFSIDREMKKGLCWKQSLRCTNCMYSSQLYKLYTEITRDGPGAKTAATNVGLQVGLQDRPIGNTKARMLIASTNTPPPALSSMQRLSNAVGTATNILNTDDMMTRKREIHETNKLRGLSADAAVNVSMDVRYNSTTIASSSKMGQNASQAIGVAIENQTDQKQIIGFHMENKLCWVGSWFRNNGFEVQCPGHAECTANVNADEPLSEKRIGESIGDDLAYDGLLVQFVTTDGDARGAEGMRMAMKKKFPDCTVERQADTTHLGQSQFRQTIRANFDVAMFPGQSAERRKEQQKILGLDIKTRCHAILSTMHHLYAGNISVVARKMPIVIDITLDCYSGDHTRCRRNLEGRLCGGGVRNSWWRRSPYLWNCGLRSLNISDADRATLKALLQLRLGVEALRLTKLNLNTNKNEAINRGLSASLPKNVNYSRNARARVSSTIHRLNHGAGVSLIKKLQAVGSPITKGRYVARAMKSFQVRSRYHIGYLKENATRRMKLYNKIRQMRAYLRAKYTKRIKPDYRKGQLDPVILDIKGNMRVNHTYSLRKRKRAKKEHEEHPYFKPLHYI
jgi:hypothetical protein